MSDKRVFDVIVIGAGSVGIPVAMNLARQKLSVLVIDELSSPGQANNKKAIGGIRATHSDKAKIKICQRSIDIFSKWKEEHGDDIGWMSNGYSFPAYTQDDEKKLKDLLKIQQSLGLNIRWISPDDYNELVPGINRVNLKGATYSPEDGSASPLMAISAMFKKSIDLGVKFSFREKVIAFTTNDTTIKSIKTDKENYTSRYIINAAGSFAREIGKLLNLDFPVVPDNHEAGITEPVKHFFQPMVVDMRPAKGSANFYFYQNHEHQVVFCITPEPPIIGVDNDSTSEFLPQVSRRMVDLYPRLAKLKVRRTWRGQYPMTPDGFPIVGKTREYDNLINAIGMCGQGYMLGPGLGELLTAIVMDNLSSEDKENLELLSLYRNFQRTEQFK